MKKYNLTTILFLFVFAAVVYGQTPVSTPLPQISSSDEDVVKITTKLVQLDAVVTDGKGNQVTDLKASDFEILQDGKPQKITGFSYVERAAPDDRSDRQSAGTNKNALPVRSTPAGAGRIITFVVDDGSCTASQIGMTASREALEKFINEQMLPNDLVAIYQTRGGSSLLQQYTSDKNQLLRVARKIRWYLNPGSCGNTNGDFFEAASSNTNLKRDGQGTFETDADRDRRQAGEDFNRNNQVVGSIGLMRYVIRGLDRVPGRKIVFLLSDGIPVRSRSGASSTAFDALRELTDLANRASVVFNTVDVRGVFSAATIGAGDDVASDDTDKLRADRAAEVRNTQDGLSYLAEETGGNFYRNQNFLDVPIRRALSRERGFYLLAYDPEDDAFKGKNFNKIEIRVKRPELRVSSRAGFIGRTDEAAKPKKRSGDSELYEAIVAPLPRAGLNIQLTAFYGNTPAEGNFVRSLVHLDGNEIAFVDEAGGLKKAVLDVVAVTLNEKNEVVDEFTRTHTFKIEAAAIPLVKQNGLIYTTDVPVKKAGTYNFRVAVRDASSNLLGSSSQIVQVPDFQKDRIFLSGLILAQADANGKFSVPAAVKPENALSLTASTAVPAIRRFKRGAILAYAYTVYNARLDKAAGQPKLSVQMNLYRDGKMLSEGKPQPAELEKQADWTRINDYSYLRLNASVQPGDYTLQVIVRDLTSNQTTSQTIDFQVIE